MPSNVQWHSGWTTPRIAERTDLTQQDESLRPRSRTTEGRSENVILNTVGDTRAKIPKRNRGNEPRASQGSHQYQSETTLKLQLVAHIPLRANLKVFEQPHLPRLKLMHLLILRNIGQASCSDPPTSTRSLLKHRTQRPSCCLSSVACLHRRRAPARPATTAASGATGT
jgi:hypothetical protein